MSNRYCHFFVHFGPNREIIGQIVKFKNELYQKKYKRIYSLIYCLEFDKNIHIDLLISLTLFD